MKIQLSDHFTYRKLIRFTLPSILMMIFTSIYGVVDGFFISNFAGEKPSVTDAVGNVAEPLNEAFVAVNLIFPLLMILATVGFIFGTGGTALVSKVFGEGDKKKANELFSLFTYVTFGLGVIFSAFGIIFIEPLSVLLGAQGRVLDYCVQYGRIILLALPFNVIQVLFQSFFVTAEKPTLGFISNLAAGFTNMILDAVLVLSLPQEYKLAGAAIATAASQTVGGVFPLFYFFRKNTSILRLGKTKYDGWAIWKACTNGSSEFMSNVSMNLVAMLYNSQLLKYSGEDGVAAYGVLMYVSLIFAAAFIGYYIGIIPVVGYHFGAKNTDELKSIFKKSILMVTAFGLCMVAVGEILSYPITTIFINNDTMLLEMTVHGFKIFALSFLFMGYAIFGSGFFTALNDGFTSAVISFVRTVIFQLASVLLLPIPFGLDGIWWSLVVAEFMAFVLSFAFLWAKRKKYKYL